MYYLWSIQLRLIIIIPTPHTYATIWRSCINALFWFRISQRSDLLGLIAQMFGSIEHTDLFWIEKIDYWDTCIVCHYHELSPVGESKIWNWPLALLDPNLIYQPTSSDFPKVHAAVIWGNCKNFRRKFPNLCDLPIRNLLKQSQTFLSSYVPQAYRAIKAARKESVLRKGT